MNKRVFYGWYAIYHGPQNVPSRAAAAINREHCKHGWYSRYMALAWYRKH